MKKTATPFDRSYWVEPGRLLAGCYPGAQDQKEAEEKLKGLLYSGIKLVISLMEEDELGHYGEPFVQYDKNLTKMAKDAGTEIECIRMPIQDLNTPSPEFMVEILDRIDQAISQENPVFVHCWGGKGRTGTVVGCFLARHGKASGENVLLEIADLRKNDPTSHQRSPETERQRSMVRCWGEGE
jgi:hypothetical protein